MEGATSGGYRNNRRGQNNNSNNNNGGNNNTGGRSRIQYDANGRPIVQCRACNLWGHFARECTTTNTPKLLCRWCGPGDHDDTKCPKSGINLITVGTDEEEVLAITRKQAKLYPDPAEEKKRLEEARAKIQKATQAETAHLKDPPSTSVWNCAEQNIVHQILQAEIPVRINYLLLTMPQLRTALTNIVLSAKQPVEQDNKKQGGTSAEDPMLLALSSGRYPAIVEMGILGTVLMDTIVDGGSCVNVLPEDTWKKLRRPTLWPPTFQLLTTDQHGIKPLGVLTAQPVTIGTQPFLLDFVVIPLRRKGYDAILGRGWLIQAKAKHDWKKNTLSLESKGRKYVIDLHT